MRVQQVALLVVAAFLIGWSLMPGRAANHREAPSLGNLATDGTDFFMFRSYEPGQGAFVTMIANWVPLESPYGGPNYFPLDPEARYEINIDNNGDAQPDQTYRFTFTNEVGDGTSVMPNFWFVSTIDDPDLNVRQTFEVARYNADGSLDTTFGGGTVVPPNLGPHSMPDYAAIAAEGVVDLSGGLRAFVGPRDDPYFGDCGIYDLFIALEPTTDAPRTGDCHAGQNVVSLALEIPIDELGGSGDIIGGWTTALLPRTRELHPPVPPTDDFVQVSRLGNPLVNELVIGLDLKDEHRTGAPSGDGVFLDRFLNPEIPLHLLALFNLAVPEIPRSDLEELYLTGIPA